MKNLKGKLTILALAMSLSLSTVVPAQAYIKANEQTYTYTLNLVKGKVVSVKNIKRIAKVKGKRKVVREKFVEVVTIDEKYDGICYTFYTWGKSKLKEGKWCWLAIDDNATPDDLTDDITIDNKAGKKLGKWGEYYMGIGGKAN